MQQHPIPQNVTQYQFRLVGDMTLKQFIELAGGLLLAYLFFASNLIFIIKWPLVILSILFGFGLAFFPIEDRPLDQWIINFLKIIYAPTRFIWQKTNKIPRLFLFVAHQPDVVNTITKTIKAPSSILNSKPVSDLSEVETTQISSLDSLFASLPASPQIQPNPQTLTIDHVEKPTIAVRKLNAREVVEKTILHTPTPISIAIPKDNNVTPTIEAPTKENVVFTAPSAPKANLVTPSTSAKQIALPASPKEPNLITGVVVDKSNKLIENAIVQIVSADGIPQRAMKTNSLGQFYTSTPLSSGSYVIEVDKEGLTYSPQQLVVNNTILSPIELRATS